LTNHLLDVSVVIAALIPAHPDHERVDQWLSEITPVLCPIAEIGWIRIATRAYGLSVEDARAVLAEFSEHSEFVACDLSALKATSTPSSGKTTDWYLADLAEKHGMKWATLDTRANHPNAELV